MEEAGGYGNVFLTLNRACRRGKENLPTSALALPCCASLLELLFLQRLALNSRSEHMFSLWAVSRHMASFLSFHLPFRACTTNSLSTLKYRPWWWNRSKIPLFRCKWHGTALLQHQVMHNYLCCWETAAVIWREPVSSTNEGLNFYYFQISVFQQKTGNSCLFRSACLYTSKESGVEGGRHKSSFATCYSFCCCLFTAFDVFIWKVIHQFCKYASKAIFILKAPYWNMWTCNKKKSVCVFWCFAKCLFLTNKKSVIIFDIN